MNEMTLQKALSERRTVRNFDNRDLERDVLQRLLWAAQGITCESNKRTAPSAHAMHPLRLMVVAGAVDGLATGLHSVDRRSMELAQISRRDLRKDLEAAALEDQQWLGCAACIIAICADFVAPASAFAEQPPVGRRGARYVYLEAGAVMQNVLLQAAAEGLACVPVAGFKDEATANVLGVEPPLAPVVLVCIGWPQPDD